MARGNPKYKTNIFSEDGRVEVMDRSRNSRYNQPIQTNAQIERLQWHQGVTISADYVEGDNVEVMDRSTNSRYNLPLQTNAHIDRLQLHQGVTISTEFVEANHVYVMGRSTNDCLQWDQGITIYTYTDHVISQPSGPRKRKNYDFSLIPSYIAIAKRFKRDFTAEVSNNQVSNNKDISAVNLLIHVFKKLIIPNY